MFQMTIRASRALDGRRSLPGIIQATNKGLNNLITKSSTGICTIYLIKGLISEKPRYIAKIVRVRSNRLNRTKETFSQVHLLNVAEESHQLVTSRTFNRPILV